MILGNQIEWALHCMTILARIPQDKFIPTKILAAFHGIPKEYLSKAMQALASAKLIEGTLGPKGGYRIAKEPSKISLLEIVEAIEGEMSTFNCQEIRFNNPCLKQEQKRKSSVCMIARVMYQADEAWRSVLREKNLSDIVRELRNEVPSDILERSDKWIQSEM